MTPPGDSGAACVANRNGLELRGGAMPRVHGRRPVVVRVELIVVDEAQLLVLQGFARVELQGAGAGLARGPRRAVHG